MKVKDIIKEDKFNEFLSYELEAYNKRPQPEEGRRYRRTPFDSLKDEGKFNIQSIITLNREICRLKKISE